MAKSYVAFKREVLSNLPQAEVRRMGHDWFVTLRGDGDVSVTGSSHADGEEASVFCSNLQASIEECVKEQAEYVASLD